jgi:hypothetical protein
MHLTVVLGTKGEVSFDISLYQNPFTEKWINELRWCLNNCDFNQDEAFTAFKNKQNIQNRLTAACVTINKYLKNFIEIRQNLDEQPQEYFNYLHQKFESLSGEYNKPTRLFVIANHELKSAIRDLNFYVHAFESYGKQSFYISFNKDQYRRYGFSEDDYDYFQFECEPGTLILHYAELGKNYFDLYKDGLDISYQGFKNLHYYSGEASLLFSGFSMTKNSQYINWLEKNNIDPFNKSLGHGIICLGKVLDLDTTYTKITDNKHIKQIIIKD